MLLRRLCLCALLTGALAFAQQENSPSQSDATTQKDIDPQALQVLKAALDPIRAAKNYSFTALVSREHLGTNGQIITLFHVSKVNVQRPDKMRIEFHGQGKDVELYYNGGNAVLYTPSEKIFSSFPAPKTIDAALDDLERRDVFVPIRNFLESDPYISLTDGLHTGYVVGRVMVFDELVHELAFTEPDAEWQLWVTGGSNPRVLRMQVIDKSKAFLPRITLQFADWNLNANSTAESFTFHKPEDAKEVPLATTAAQGRKNP